MFRLLRYFFSCLVLISIAALLLSLSTDAGSLSAAIKRYSDLLGVAGALLLLLLSGALYLLARYADGERNKRHAASPLALVESDEAAQEQQSVVEGARVPQAEVEKKLRDNEAYLQAVMANIFNGIICIDQHGLILSFNPTAERMFGYSQQQVMGKNVSMLMPAEHARRHDSYLENYLRTGKATIIGSLRALKGLREDGSEFPMELAIAETQVANEPLFIGTIRDTSAQASAEKALFEARQKYYHQEKMAAIGFLSAGLVHEIGNPIAAISGLLDGICDPGIEPLPCSAKANEQLKMIQEQVDRIIKITRDVSEFATPQAQGADLQDLNALIGRTCGLMRHDRRFSEVELKLQLDSQIPAIYAVGDHLIQVLMNLLANAVDAVADNIAQPGLIIITTGVDAGRVWFEVADNGCGMNAEVLSHAGEAFYTTKAVGQGTGLGLSLCESLLSEQGGTMTIRSQPGQGSWIRVILLTQSPTQDQDSV